MADSIVAHETTTSVSTQCLSCIATLKSILAALSTPRPKSRLSHSQVKDELERLSLWVGNIGAIHESESPLSMESRLRDASDVLSHIQDLLGDLYEVAVELLKIATGEREGEVDIVSMDAGSDGKVHLEEVIEESELLQEIGACIARLFRTSSLIRQAAPADLFLKALSKSRLQFNDEFDIAHVSHKFPKLAKSKWLQQRLGRAITKRRQYLSYVQHHRDNLGGSQEADIAQPTASLTTQNLPIEQPQIAKTVLLESASRPSTHITKASTLAPGRITTQMLITAQEESDPEDDARSYTTISRSVDGDHDSSTLTRIPKLTELRTGGVKNEVECPFCFRMKRFKDERLWQRHVFSDLRSYVCTFPDCNAQLYGDINQWFRHEMQTHRACYVCRFCGGKAFNTQDRFLTHIRRHHTELLEDGEQALLDISSKPVDQIPATDCPCCDDWTERLQGREQTYNHPEDNSEETVIMVSPAIFKRHLAAHLEQLSLFAVPIGSTSGGNADSNMAIEETESELSKRSQLSVLTFPSVDVPLDIDPEMKKTRLQLTMQPESTSASSADHVYMLSERELWLIRKTLKKWHAQLDISRHRSILERNPRTMEAPIHEKEEDQDPNIEFSLKDHVAKDIDQSDAAKDESGSESSATTVVKDPPDAYRPVSNRFIVYINTASASRHHHELNLEEGQAIYITHERDQAIEPCYYGYNPANGEGGTVYRYNVTLPFIAVFKDSFHYIRLYCAVCHRPGRSRSGGCVCGSDTVTEAEPQYIKPGIEVLVTQAMSGNSIWKGYYLIKDTPDSVLVEFEADCVVRKEQYSARGKEVSQTSDGLAPSPPVEPVYEAIEPPALLVAKHFNEVPPPQGTRFLELRPGLRLRATHTVLVGSERYYYGHSVEVFDVSKENEAESRLFPTSHVIPRVSQVPIIDDDWDHGDTLSVRISQEMRSKLLLDCMCKLLDELKADTSCPITIEERCLKITGGRRFEALETVLHYSKWPIDVDFEQFSVSAGPNDTTLTVGDKSSVRVLNFGPDRDWYFGITEGSVAKILIFPNVITRPSLRRPAIQRPSLRHAITTLHNNQSKGGQMQSPSIVLTDTKPKQTPL